jgi:hypothetical protein
MDHIKVARWTYYTGNFQKQTFIECDRPDKRRVSYESRRPWVGGYVVSGDKQNISQKCKTAN